MESINFIFAVNYKGMTPIALEDKKLSFLGAVFGGQPKEIPQSGMRFNHAETKTVLVMEEGQIAISVEAMSVEDSEKRIKEILADIYKNFPFDKKEIARVGVRIQWINEWGSSFTKLLSEYKGIFYKDVPILNESGDVAVHLTLKDGGCGVNYITGPMKPDQAKMFINFKDRKFPHDFMYVDIDRFLVDTKIKNDLDSLNDFIGKSIEYSKLKATETVDLFNKNKSN